MTIQVLGMHASICYNTAEVVGPEAREDNLIRKKFYRYLFWIAQWFECQHVQLETWVHSVASYRSA